MIRKQRGGSKERARVGPGVALAELRQTVTALKQCCAPPRPIAGTEGEEGCVAPTARREADNDAA